MAFDLLITGGMVVDGTGAPARRADVSVRAGRIVEIGKSLDGSAGERVDATDLVVAPGFIDSHTHLDGQLFWDKEASSSSWHGCTSVIFGNCGFSLAPIPDSPEYPTSLLAGVEQIPRRVLDATVPFDWRNYQEFVASLEGSGLGVNAAGYVGYPTVRHSVMGERAFTDAATEADLSAIAAALREALSAGALGVSINRNDADHDDHGRESAGYDCDWSEIDRALSVVGEYPGTIVQAVPSWAILNEGITDAVRLEFERWVDSLRRADRRLVWGALMEPFAGPLLGLIREAAREGVSMLGAVGSIPVAGMATFETTSVFSTVEGWESVFELGRDERVRALSDPAVRERLKAACRADGTFVAYPLQTKDAAGNRVLGPVAIFSWDNVFRIAAPPAPFEIGESVLAESQRMGSHPLDLVLDGAVASDLAEFLLMVPYGYMEDVTQSLLTDPGTVLSINDTGAHLLVMSNAGSTFLFSHWVRAKGAITLEQAVHLLTGRQAEVFGLADRGVIAAGKAADIVVFDPTTVAPLGAEYKVDIPGGGSRFVQRSRGITRVVVNGRSLLVDGKATGDLGGRYLRPADMLRSR
jgi:N-acyl-D-amino-acid deacylase